MTATRDDLLKTTAAKSDYLTADELAGEPKLVTITDVIVVTLDSRDKTVLHLAECKPFLACASTMRTIMAMWHDQPEQWKGRQLQLFRDPDVTYKKDATGGIRLCGASNLSQEFSITLTEHQRNRITRTIKPLQTAAPKSQPSIADRVERAIAAYRACNTADELMALGDKSEQLRTECDDVSKLKLTTVFESAMNKFNEGTN